MIKHICLCLLFVILPLFLYQQKAVLSLFYMYEFELSAHSVVSYYYVLPNFHHFANFLPIFTSFVPFIFINHLPLMNY